MVGQHYSSYSNRDLTDSHSLAAMSTETDSVKTEGIETEHINLFRMLDDTNQ